MILLLILNAIKQFNIHRSYANDFKYTRINDKSNYMLQMHNECTSNPEIPLYLSSFANITNIFDDVIYLTSLLPFDELRQLFQQIPCFLDFRNQLEYRPMEQEQNTFKAGWYLDRIDQPDLPLDNKYHFNFTGKGTNIYLIDSGVILNDNAELGQRVKMPFTAPGLITNADECTGHGSMVASIAAGKNIGVAKLANVIVLRVLSGCNSTEAAAKEEDIVKALNWLKLNVKKPAVINMSLGPQQTENFSSSSAVDAAVSKLIDMDIPIVVAAGNDNANACRGSPSSVPDVITVGSTDRNDARAGFSNFGNCISIFAPGVDVYGWSIDPKNGKFNADYIKKEGTSYSTPQVSGAIALIFESNGAIPLASLKKILYKNSVLKVTDSKTLPKNSRLLQVGNDSTGTSDAVNILDSVFQNLDPDPWYVTYRLHLIIGVSILIFLALILAVCIVWNRRRNKSRNSFIQKKTFNGQRPPPQTITSLNQQDNTSSV